MKKILKNKTHKNSPISIHIVVAILTCLVLVVIMQWDRGLFKAEFREGDIALRDIFASYDFTIKGDINSIATDERRREAMDSVLPIYLFDSETKDTVLTKIDSIRESVEPLKSMSPASPDAVDEENGVKIAEMVA